MPHTLKKIENSQHFSFIRVCPADVSDQEPVVCNDPPGFDREQFHIRLNSSVAVFSGESIGSRLVPGHPNVSTSWSLLL